MTGSVSLGRIAALAGVDRRLTDLADLFAIGFGSIPAAAALKHFWHMLLVDGLAVTPQLLEQSVGVVVVVKVSRTLNSVSSFSVLCAICVVDLLRRAYKSY